MVLRKDVILVHFEDILGKIKTLSEEEKNVVNQVIAICKLLHVYPATSGVGERSFPVARILIT